MNIIERSISENIDEQYLKYGDKVKDIQQSLDFDLKNYDNKSDKVIRLDNLSKVCDMMIEKSKEEKEKNFISNIIKLVKACIILLCAYSFATYVVPEVTNGSFDMSILPDILMKFLAYAVIVAVACIIGSVIMEIVKKGYDAKLMQISLKKIVIESNYKELSKIGEEEVKKEIGNAVIDRIK